MPDLKPQLIRMQEGYLKVAIVENGRKRLRVLWFKEHTFTGRTKEEVLAEIDRFRAEIASQEPLKPSEYE